MHGEGSPEGDAVPYLVRCVGVLCRVLDVPHGQRRGGPAPVFVVGDLLHVVVVVVDEHAGDVSKGVQRLGCLGHPPLFLDVDEVGDLQFDALQPGFVAVDGEACKGLPGVGEEFVKEGAPFSVAHLEEQHRVILADGELAEGGFLRRFRVFVVLEINADDLVALEAEVVLVLREGDRHLLLVVGVDDVQLGVAVRLHDVVALLLVGECHRRWQGLVLLC